MKMYDGSDRAPACELDRRLCNNSTLLLLPERYFIARRSEVGNVQLNVGRPSHVRGNANRRQSVRIAGCKMFGVQGTMNWRPVANFIGFASVEEVHVNK